jgi:integrase
MRSSDPISIPLPFEDWPVADRQAWEVAVTPASLFGNGGTAAHWALATLHGYRATYGRWLRFLISRGWSDAQAPFGSRARPDRVAAYVESLEVRVSPLSVWSYISDLHNIHYRLAPDHDWSWLRDIVNRLHLRVGSRHIAPGRLRPIDELFRAGMAAMDRAEAEGPQPRLRDSVHYRNGLMVALLAATLLRMNNFARLELGRTLIRQSDGYLLAVPSAEVKNRQEIEQAIIGRLTPYLDRYFTHHHPRLLQGGESKHLWINQYGGVMKPHAVGAKITKVTRGLVGAPISAHLFRHCAATTIAIEDPEHAMIIRSLLAHSRADTADRYYNKASIAEAGRKHAATIAGLRQNLESMSL